MEDTQNESYSLAAGILRFENVPIISPIIDTLFAEFELEEWSKDKFEYHVNQEHHMDWSDIAEQFNENAQKFGIFDNEERSLFDWCDLLSNQMFGKAFTLFSQKDLDDSYSLDIPTLFKLANYFKDGHNLNSLKMEWVRYADRQISEALEGGNHYCSEHFNYSNGTHEVGNLIEDMGKNVDKGQFELVAASIVKTSKQLLDGIDPLFREAVFNELRIQMDTQLTRELAKVQTNYKQELTSTKHKQSCKP